MSYRRLIKLIIKPFYKTNFGQKFIGRFIDYTVASPLMRRIFTKNYSSGFLSVGEQNRFCVAPNWITVDLDGADYNIDLRKKERLPFKDGSISLIYSSHMIEHLNDETCQFFFQEASRLLSKNGVLRLEAPDTIKIVDAYKSKDIGFFEKMLNKDEKKRLGVEFDLFDVFVGLLSCYIVEGKHIGVKVPRDEALSMLNSASPEEFAKWCISFQDDWQKLSGGHINPITYKKLKNNLIDAGFTNISEMSIGQSKSTLMQSKLKNIERTHRGYFSVIAEAAFH